MIKCKGEFGCVKCVVEMDAQESDGGNVCCDKAEDLEFCRESILQNCEYASEINI